MPIHRWSQLHGRPGMLGVVLHGPALLARSPGIAAGIRCVFGSPDGLSFTLLLHAEGVQATAANRRTGMYIPPEIAAARAAGLRARHRRSAPTVPESAARLLVGIDGLAGEAFPNSSESGGDDEHFDLRSEYTVAAVPTDGRLTLTIAWDDAGLAEQTTTLMLTGLDRLDQAITLM